MRVKCSVSHYETTRENEFHEALRSAVKSLCQKSRGDDHIKTARRRWPRHLSNASGFILNSQKSQQTLKRLSPTEAIRGLWTKEVCCTHFLSFKWVSMVINKNSHVGLHGSNSWTYVEHRVSFATLILVRQTACLQKCPGRHGCLPTKQRNKLERLLPGYVRLAVANNVLIFYYGGFCYKYEYVWGMHTHSVVRSSLESLFTNHFTSPGLTHLHFAVSQT